MSWGEGMVSNASLLGGEETNLRDTNNRHGESMEIGGSRTVAGGHRIRDMPSRAERMGQ